MTASRRHALAAMCVCVVLVAVVSLIRWRHTRPWLPYSDHFAQNQVSEWIPYGGVWHLHDGIVTNRSDEGGAKLVTGSPDWTDYQVTADVQMREYDGDVGLVVRAGNLRDGMDALQGYYALLRSDSKALVLGIANENHLERRPVRLEGGLRPQAWYRLHIVVVGCEMAVEARDLATQRATYAALRDERGHCFRSGKIVLRSSYRGGAWRNIHVDRAQPADLQRLERHTGPALTVRYPIREDEYARMWESYSARPVDPDPEVPIWVHEVEGSPDEPAVTEIAALRSLSLPSQPVHLRGTVTSTSPLYIQDTTGGTRIENPQQGWLNVGDEIEATGRVDTLGSEQVLRASAVQLLWERTPVAPISIAPSQASSGQLDGSLIEVSGTLLSTRQMVDGSTTLRLENASEIFTLTLQRDAFNSLSGDWAVGSTLRARGICTPANDPSTDGAFTLRVASASSIQLLSGPPWWSGWRLGAWIALVLGILGAGFYMVLRGERSKMRAIMEERERLAHNMHDTLAQNFAGVAYFLQGLRKALVESGVPQAQVQDVSLACDMVAGAHRDASASIAALHPDAQGNGDLLPMLERAAAAMLEGSLMPLESRSEGPPHRLSPTQTDVLFRVGKEAIANVLRHAHATRIELKLLFAADTFSLSIADDGRGIESGTAAWGFGLRGMQQRCASIDAELKLISASGRGCTVEITVPYCRQDNLMRRLQRTLLRTVS